jgi:hypothetical protein
MQPETETSPFVMLILRPYIIDPSCPKMVSLETTVLASLNLFRLHHLK